MALSGTYNFNLDVLDIIEEAYDNLGTEARVAYDLQTAIRSLDLLMLEWANRQVNLWTVELDTQALSDGTTTYTISNPVIDILDAVITNSDGTDIPIHRWSMEEYLQQPNKAQESRPTHFTTVRGENSITLYTFPTPDTSYTLKYWSMNMVQDAGNYTNNMEVPKRFLPALIAGLSYKLALKNPAKMVASADGRPFETDGVSTQRRQELRQNYEQLFSEARDEDRERASFYVVPAIGMRR